MTLAEIIFDGGVGVAVLLTLIQITPIKINPWSALAKAFCKPFTSGLSKQLEEIEKSQKELKQILDNHIREDGERCADACRSRILQFNTELMRGMQHTEEDFVEALSEIDKYETYCGGHPQYANNRAVLAVSNIKRAYSERLEKNDFLGETR